MITVLFCVIFAIAFMLILWFEPPFLRKIMGEMGKADYMKFIANHDPELMSELKKRGITKDE